jgi:hypothetical protein
MFYGSELVYVVLAPLSIVGMFVLAIVALAGRNEPDSRGERAYVLYLSIVSFVALFTVLFALVNLASTLTHMVLDPSAAGQPYTGDPLFAPDFEDEYRTRDALNAGAAVLVAGAILLLHRRRSQHLVDDAGFAGSAGARTFTAYLFAVAFVAMAILLVAAAVALPALIRVAAPGLTAVDSSGAERDAALTDLVPALVAGGGAVVIYLTHWRAADRVRRGDDG